LAQKDFGLATPQPVCREKMSTGFRIVFLVKVRLNNYVLHLFIKSSVKSVSKN